jgi:thiol-disulfide isomerase/thioredoxin
MRIASLMPRTHRKIVSTLLSCCLLAVTSTALQAQQPPLVSLDGVSVSLKEFQGRVVLVNFWATWCGPCLKEIPELNEISSQLDSDRAVVLGIAADYPDMVREFLTELPIYYRLVTGDPDMIFQWTEALGNFDQGLPFSILLGPDGSIQWRKSGPIANPEEALAQIAQLMAGGGG